MRRQIDNAFYLVRGQAYYGVINVAGENVVTRAERRFNGHDITKKERCLISWYPLDEAMKHQSFLKSKGIIVELNPVII